MYAAVPWLCREAIQDYEADKAALLIELQAGGRVKVAEEEEKEGQDKKCNSGGHVR